MNGPPLSGKVQTVLGLVEPDDLGVTLPHEHLLLDQWDNLGREDTSNETPLLFSSVYLDSDEPQIRQIESLIEDGFQNKLLISHDVCFQFQHTGNGGRGYAHILESIVPRMRKRGCGEDLIDTIIVDNPKIILTFE